jgi:hypothetical protein
MAQQVAAACAAQRNGGEAPHPPHVPIPASPPWESRLELISVCPYCWDGRGTISLVPEALAAARLREFARCLLDRTADLRTLKCAIERIVAEDKAPGPGRASDAGGCQTRS